MKLGIIDIGSNSITLCIAELYKEEGYFKILDEEKETVRLGKDTLADGTLHHDRMQKALLTLKYYKSLCDTLGVTKIKAVATEAVRKAPNQEYFINLVLEMTGISIEILSGDEEAYFAYVSTVATFTLKDYFMMDIGGSSLEIGLVRNRELVAAVSLPLGAIPISECFNVSDPLTPETSLALKRYLTTQFQAIPWLASHQNLPLIGVGGSLRNISKIHKKMVDDPMTSNHHYTLSNETVKNLYGYISKMDLKQKRKLKGLSKDRADIFTGALGAVLELMNVTNACELVISQYGIRQGLIYDTLVDGNLSKLHPIDDSIQYFMNIGQLDAKHPHHVYHLSQKLLLQLEPLLVLTQNVSDVFKVAALLFNVGTSLTFENHYAHSFYMILNGGLTGLNQTDLLRSAYVAALSHKSQYKLPLAYKALLSDAQIQEAQQLGIIIKLAKTLDRGLDHNVYDVSVTMTENTVIVKTNAKKFPYLEINKVYQIADAFEKVFEKKLVVTN
ncbi:MAG TPA: hypothetical protein DCY20_09570 [Firmicutes bacterium]|nr:hypothetical protein [Bacillota bacterium]